MIEMIDESQIEDFRTLVTERGLDPSDFELTSEQDPLIGVLPHPITGRVLVKRMAPVVQRSYSFQSWFSEFYRDLRRGIFNRN